MLAGEEHEIKNRRIARGEVPTRRAWTTGRLILGVAIALLATGVFAGLGMRLVSPGLSTPSPAGEPVAASGASTAVPAYGNLTLATPPTHQVFVSPDGTSQGDGTREKPFDLPTVLSATGPVSPGDTVWLRGGVYEGNFKSDLRGIETMPIIVRQYPGERATIVGLSTAPALTIQGAYTWYADFEVTSKTVRRSGGLSEGMTLAAGTGVRAGGLHVKVINLVIHDRQSGGLTVQADAPGVEVFGNLIYYNGWMRADQIGQGNGIDLGNKGSVPRFIRDNIVFSQFGAGLFGGVPFDNVHLDGNVFFNSGSLSKSPDRHIFIGPEASITLTNNATYYAKGLDFRGTGVIIGYGGVGGCRSARITNNYLTGSNPFTLFKCEPSAIDGNTFYGYVDPQVQGSYPRNSYIAVKPGGQVSITGTKVFVRPNQYEPGRANIIVFNWDRLANVPVDLSSVRLEKGTMIEIRDSQNFFGPPVFKGSYTGEHVMVPMRGLSVGTPTGEVPTPPTHTGPEFGVFIVAIADRLPQVNPPAAQTQ